MKINLSIYHTRLRQIINLSANFLLLTGVLLLCRLYFLVINRQYINPSESWTLYAESFLVGLRFDLSVAAYFHFVLLAALLTVWLIYSFPVWQKWQQTLLQLLNGILALFYIVFLVADTQFYHEFSSHLSFKETDYLTSLELAGTIAADYPIVLPAVVILLLFLSYLVLSKRLLRSAAAVTGNWKKNLLWLPLNFVLAGGLLLIAARGGIGLSTLNWGAAVFSSDPFANQLALNGLFSFGKSYDMEKNDDGEAVLQNMGVKYDEAVKIVRQELDSTDIYLDSLGTNREINPLARLTITGQPLQKKNVVVILLESWMAEYIGALGSISGVTPCFDQLASEGVLFTNFYTGGPRSNRGIVSVVTGYPSHYGTSVMKRIGGQKAFYSLPGILKERGYQTSFIYGGDPEFDNMQGFFRNNGVNEVIGQSDFPITAKAGKWGVSDDIMFERATNYLASCREPFFSLIFTLSNHEPFEAPEGFKRFTAADSGKYRYMNTYAYSDQALGRFFEKLKNQPFFHNTIFVLVADHGLNRNQSWLIDPHRYHIPLLLINSGLPAAKVEITGNQSDILPTVLSLLGGEFTQASWGRNLLKVQEERAVYLSPGDIFGMVKKDTLLTVDLQSNFSTFLFSDKNKLELLALKEPGFAEKYRSKAKAFFALSYMLLKNGKYGK